MCIFGTCMFSTKSRQLPLASIGCCGKELTTLPSALAFLPVACAGRRRRLRTRPQEKTRPDQARRSIGGTDGFNRRGTRWKNTRRDDSHTAGTSYFTPPWCHVAVPQSMYRRSARLKLNKTRREMSILCPHMHLLHGRLMFLRLLIFSGQFGSLCCYCCCRRGRVDSSRTPAITWLAALAVSGQNLQTYRHACCCRAVPTPLLAELILRHTSACRQPCPLCSLPPPFASLCSIIYPSSPLPSAVTFSFSPSLPPSSESWSVLMPNKVKRGRHGSM